MSDQNQVEKAIDETVPPWTPNRSQIIGFLASVSSGIGWLLAHAGIALAPDVQSALFGPDALTFYSGVVLSAWPLVYAWYVHSRNGKLRAVESMPSVEKIIIKPIAPPDVQKIADDSDRSKVVQLPKAA